MKKKITLPLVALLLAAAAWYLWPRSVWSTLPGFQRDQPATRCYAVLLPRDPEAGPSTQTVELPLDSSQYQALTALLESTSYVRSPGDLLRLGQISDAQLITLDTYAHLCLRQGTDLFQLTFYGPHIIAEQLGGASRTYLPMGGETIQEEVVRLLIDCGAETA